MSHIFPFDAYENKATNKKYTSNERKFYISLWKDSKTGW